MNRRERRSGKKRKAGKPEKIPKALHKMSLEQVLQEGDAAVDAMDAKKATTCFETAARLLRSKISQEPKRMDELITVLGKLGETKTLNGDQVGARTCFVEAANRLEGNLHVPSILPKTQTATIYLYLAQLSAEEEALFAYQKGIEYLESSLQGHQYNTNAQNDLSPDFVRRQLAGAFCSIAELYMTDLCYTEGAEEACQLAISRALDIQINGNPTPDALQGLASLRLSQSRADEAPQHILAAYQQMKPGCEALSTLVGLGDSTSAMARPRPSIELNLEVADNLPDYAFRRQTARLLVECASIAGGMHTEDCAQAAISVLGSLFAEDDEDAEVWYLTGCAHMTLQTPQQEAATSYFEKTIGLLKETRESLLIGDNDDGELEEIEKKIEEVSTKLQQIRQPEGEHLEMDDM